MRGGCQKIKFEIKRQKKCPQKVFTKIVHKSVRKKCPQKVSTKNKRGAEGERKVSGRGGANERQATLLNSPLNPTKISAKDKKKTKILFRDAFF